MKYKAGPGKNEVFGRNYFNKILKDLAVTCGYDNPMRCTAHGKQRGGNSAIVNLKEEICEKLQLKVCRHKLGKTNAQYTEFNANQHNKTICALQPSAALLPTAKSVPQEGTKIFCVLYFTIIF